MFADLGNVLRQIEPLDAEWIRRAETRQASLTKPPGSLGRLEEVANRLVAIQGSLTPKVDRARIVVFAAHLCPRVLKAKKCVRFVCDFVCSFGSSPADLS